MSIRYCRIRYKENTREGKCNLVLARPRTSGVNIFHRFCRDIRSQSLIFTIRRRDPFSRALPFIKQVLNGRFYSFWVFSFFFIFAFLFLFSFAVAGIVNLSSIFIFVWVYMYILRVDFRLDIILRSCFQWK